MKMKNSNLFRLKDYATFSKSDTWNKHLKADLEKIKEEAALSESDLGTVEKYAVRDIKRTTTIQIVNRIIRLIERADDKVTNS